MSEVTFDWGDGKTSPATVGEEVTHRYQYPGDYRIAADTADGKGHGDAPFHADPVGGGEQYELVIPSFIVKAGVPTEYDTTLNNSGDELPDAYGYVGINGPKLGGVSDLIWEQQDVTGGGAGWQTISGSLNGPGAVFFKYGPFTVLEKQHGTAKCRLTVAADSKLGREGGTLWGLSTIADSRQSTVYARVAYTIAVEPAA